MGTQRNDLQTKVDSLFYDFDKKYGTLQMPRYNNTSMDGCIALFKRIDPSVRTIFTFAGGRQDTSYHKNNDGEWTAAKPNGGYFFEKAARFHPWPALVVSDELDTAEV